jgi:hypothetical protein
VEEKTMITIGVQYPQAGDYVPGNGTIIARGATVPAAATVTATIGNTSGTRMTPTPPDTWAFKFTNIAINVDVTLDVHAEYEGARVDKLVTFQCTAP